MLLTGGVHVEVVLNLLDTVAVVLSLKPPPVQDGVPVLIPLLFPGVAPVVPGVAGVQSGHHPVAEVGAGGAGSGNFQCVETQLSRGEGGDLYTQSVIYIQEVEGREAANNKETLIS